MKELKELANLIADKLDISDQFQRDCVANILSGSLALSGSRNEDLTHKRLDFLTNLIKGFIEEIKELSDEQDKYENKLKSFSEIINKKLAI